MKLDSILAVIEALNQGGVRFLVAGGVAVNLHGYTRATQDLDLVVELSMANAASATRALAGLGYRPQVPAAIEDFADPDKRQRWIDEKHMQVFSLVSDRHPDTTVDLFVTQPIPFDEEYRSADVYEIAPGIAVRVVRPAALVDMKQAVGRHRDYDDIEHLRWILQQRDEGAADD